MFESGTLSLPLVIYERHHVLSLLQSPTSAPSATSRFLSIPLSRSLFSSSPHLLFLSSPLLPSFSHPPINKPLPYSLPLCASFSSSFPLVLVFNNSSSALLLPLGEKLPLSQANTINQSLVSLSLPLSALHLPSLLPLFPALFPLLAIRILSSFHLSCFCLSFMF